MRRVLTLLLITTLLFAPIGGAFAQGPPDHAGPPSSAGPSFDVSSWTGTSPVNDSNFEGQAGDVLLGEDNESVLRVEDQYTDLTSVNISEETVNNTSELAMNLTIPSEENATNVTFYIQSSAVEDNTDGNVSGLDLLVDGNESEFMVDESAGPGNSPWILFEVDEFSSRDVTFAQTDNGGPSGTFSPPPSDGMDSFLDTVTPDEANIPDQLVGKMSVSANQSQNLSVEIEQDETWGTEMLMNSSVNETTTVYINTDALESVGENTTNESLNVEIDNENTTAGITEQDNQRMVTFQIDHFSEREVSISDTEAGGVVSTLGIAAPIVVVAILVVLGSVYYFGRDGDIDFI